MFNQKTYDYFLGKILNSAPPLASASHLYVRDLPFKMLKKNSQRKRYERNLSVHLQQFQGSKPFPLFVQAIKTK
jgi:hypothetical protein